MRQLRDREAGAGLLVDEDDLAVRETDAGGEEEEEVGLARVRLQREGEGRRLRMGHRKADPLVYCTCCGSGGEAR